jgi:hypothetical protein
MSSSDQGTSRAIGRTPDLTAFRGAVEGALRGVALLALIVVLIIAILRLYTQPNDRLHGTAALAPALVRWSTREAPAQVEVGLDNVPTPAERDWLAALRGAGTLVNWEGQGLTPTGIIAEPVADPQHPVRIWAAVPPNTAVTASDAVGQLGTQQTTVSAGVVWVTPSLSGVARVQANNVAAFAPVRDTLLLHSLLVIATAGWEAKFAVMALEERGWKVDARLTLSPKAVVLQGPAVPVIDTAHYSAVILLDSSAAKQAAAITEYVRSGGGLIVMGEAARLPSIEALLPARKLGEPMRAGRLVNDGTSLPAPRYALELLPLTELADDSVPLERRGNQVAAAARRIERGRVLQTGYLDTWRWRMAVRSKQSADDYREWWSGLVSQVANTTRSDRVLPVAERAALDPAPVADLYATLGAPAARSQSAWRWILDPRLMPWLFAIIVIALLVEWMSRRLRGAR